MVLSWQLSILMLSVAALTIEAYKLESIYDFSGNPGNEETTTQPGPFKMPLENAMGNQWIDKKLETMLRGLMKKRLPGLPKDIKPSQMKAFLRFLPVFLQDRQLNAYQNRENHYHAWGG